MDIVINTFGDVRMIYHEGIDPHAIGRPTIRRGSHVEPTADGYWTADLSPVDGPVLGPFKTRSSALAAEVAWLGKHWLNQ
ncbi:hypothetical protein [Rubripirellula reticaptiva]|uniref:Uncharacterized protein n=1 Tax=Rubripirellula reticaptiva TaxID=2528013 RepID=A0A5C6EUL9_9BACT|nr:hypothetical protein [Rubripirellula reticaptiva]TWU51149.1 hypothetical protein Poly59_27390 [Rubripirellula reticaptiva]